MKQKQLEARIATLENLMTAMVATWAIEMNDPEGESEYIFAVAGLLAQDRLRMAQVGPEKQVARSALRNNAAAYARIEAFLKTRWQE